MRAQVELAWKTQAGHRHQVEGLENEDAVWVTFQHPVFDAVLMVADGMGGHPRPKEASQTAVAKARQAINAPSDNLQTSLAGAVQQAHRAVLSLRNGAGKPPGTTLSLAVIADAVLYIAHVGDGSVFLMRDGSARCIAGGEDRRAGNRPQQFLGQDGTLEPELRQVSLQPGDRLLLCTDGLTRYFNEAGKAALEEVLGRESSSVSTIAAQLTSHSRPDDYDDDTTVAVASVTGLAESRPRPTPTREKPAVTHQEPPMPPPSSGLSLPALVFAAVAGAGLLGGGFWAGRMTAPSPKATTGQPTPLRQAATSEELGALPPGNVVLFDPLARRIYSLASRPVRAPEGTVDLQGFRVGPDGRLADAGAFRLDASRTSLNLPSGSKLPVEVDPNSGSIRVLRGGVLQVDTRPPGANVLVNGNAVGASPQRLTVPAGHYRVRVEATGWARETEVDVPAAGAVTVSLGRP